MSAATAPDPRTIRRNRPPQDAPPVVQGVVAATIALDVGVLAAGAVAARANFLSAGWDLVFWIAAVAIAGAASLSFESGSQLGLDMPVLLAAGFLYGPVVGGVIAVIAYVDAREFRREVSLRRALFNRAQTSLSVMAATAVFAAIAGETESWFGLLAAALTAVGVDCFINYGMVAGVLALYERISLVRALSQLRFGSPLEFGATWVMFGLLSLTLVETYESAGAWALLVFSIPLLLARQALARGGRLESANRRIVAQSTALMTATARAADERREERLALAAGIHDELLPSMFRVHLMGQVLRQDLATGQLLALEEDLPELLVAVDRANEDMRTLVRTLRESAIGTAGLAEGLRTAVESIRQETGLSIEADIPAVLGGSDLTQLLTYHVVRESLRNAARHARASLITVYIVQTSDSIELAVEDDGVGFIPSAVDRTRSFGLALMRERVELAGGTLRIDSTAGAGTRVTASIPLQISNRD